MTVSEWKAKNSYESIEFYKSKESNRFVGICFGDQVCVTTENFDHAKPAFVYTTTLENGEIIDVISNKERAKAVFTL